MPVVLFDNRYRNSLRPFTYNHAIGDIRLGIYTLQEWWQLQSDHTVYLETEDYLKAKYTRPPAGYHIFIDASVIADQELTQRILQLKQDTALADDAGIIAAHIHSSAADSMSKGILDINITKLPAVDRLLHPWQLFLWNKQVLTQQFEWLMKHRQNNRFLPASVRLTGPQDNLLIEEGAVVEHAYINTTEGPVYIAKGTLIMDSASIRGPFTLCEGSVIKMGAKIYGATTIGPGCTIGGEVKNSIFQGYSNKAHDGYIGDSVIGSWCNLGAGTSNSNVKNTANIVSIWNDDAGKPQPIGNKAGVIMGDYTRTAINASINTGSYFGLCCNIATTGFPPPVLHNFSWLTNHLQQYDFQKALRDIRNWLQFKHHDLPETEISILKYIFERS